MLMTLDQLRNNGAQVIQRSLDVNNQVAQRQMAEDAIFNSPNGSGFTPEEEMRLLNGEQVYVGPERAQQIVG